MKRTRDGYSVQIRIGEGRRPSFNVKAPDEPTFRARLQVMTELSRLLVDKGRLVEAEPSMKMLAAAGDDFDSVAAGIRDVCSEPFVDVAKPKGYAGMTFLEFGKEWTSGRLFQRFRGMHKIRAKKPKQMADDQRRVEFVASIVGPVLMRDFSLEHFEAVMAAIPDSADSDSSRRAMAQVMSWLLKRAVNLRIRTDFPLPEGSLPAVTSHREFQLLYPREDAQLMACADVDLFDRAFYGFSVRNGCRKQNFLDLRWQDIDFVDGQVWVPDTKTGKPVSFDLAPGCVRALRALKVIADANHARAEGRPGAEVPRDAKIFPQWHPDTIAQRFQGHLKLALGRDARAQLFETTAHQRPIVYHDLRASFITFALANGKSEEWIRERSGHTTSQMIARYRRPRVSKLKMTDWLPLDVALGLTVPQVTEGPAPSAPLEEAECQEQPQHDQAADEAHLRALSAAVRVPALPGGELVEPSDAPRAPAGPVGDDEPQALGEVAVASGEGEVASPLQITNGEEAHGQVQGNSTRELPEAPTCAPEGWQKPTESAPIRVATGVATEVLGASTQGEESSMFSALSLSTPGGIRTPDQRIRNQPFCAVHAHDAHVATASCARTSANAPDVAAELPVSSLRASDYERIAELALQAGEWELLARVARDRALIEAAQSTQSNVTSLLVERRRRA